jgi:hypothetical protein
MYAEYFRTGALKSAVQNVVLIHMCHSIVIVTLVASVSGK